MKVTLGSIRSLNEELDALEAVYTEVGVKVVRIPSPTTDAVFHRDVMAWTPAGLIKCRMGKATRAVEPDLWFSYMGIDPVLEIKAPGTFEGADLLWLSADEAVLACGARTNNFGQRQVFDFLTNLGITVHVVDLPRWHPQHLLGIFNVHGGEQFHMTKSGFPGTPLGDEFKGPNFVSIDEYSFMSSALCPKACEIVMNKTDSIAYMMETKLLHDHGGGIGCASGIYEMAWKEVEAI